MSNFKLLTSTAFSNYISNLKVKRAIKTIQLHHTWSPSYKQFNGSNHETLQSNMRNYHVKTNGWSDIGQHFTIFPDGKVCTGRSLDSTPAGISGANTGAICIECLGNFDKGGDTMTSNQKEAIVSVVKSLLKKFNLNASTSVTYHAWWTSSGKSLGTYVQGKSAKTCPGTNFFGGNTREAFEKNLLPLLNNHIKESVVEREEIRDISEVKDIVEALASAGVLTNVALWDDKCNSDKDVYWLCYKMANKLNGLGLINTSYEVQVTDGSLNYRTGPGTSYDIVGTITDKGIYTIVNEKDGWGQLKSLVGWINLKYTKRV